MTHHDPRDDVIVAYDGFGAPTYGHQAPECFEDGPKTEVDGYDLTAWRDLGSEPAAIQIHTPSDEFAALLVGEDPRLSLADQQLPPEGTE